MRRTCVAAALLLLAGMSGCTQEGSPTVPMAFAHVDHREQNCLVCHHNFADSTGQGLCIDCHVRDVELRSVFETQFHELCRGCHVALARNDDKGGPPRRCVDCHHLENSP